MATKTVGVSPQGEGIEVRFKYKGKTVRPRLQMAPTKANMLHASRLRKQIVDEISHGTFNMLAHFPDYKFADRIKASQPTDARTVDAWFKVWAKVAERELEHSTLAVYKRHMVAYWLPVFGELLPSQVSNEMVLTRMSDLATDQVDAAGKITRRGLGRKTQNNILIPLRNVFGMISRAPGAGPDPTEGVENMRVQTGDPDPFTMEEVDLALEDVRERLGDNWADYFEFAAFAGLRVSEQIALLWEDVDLRTNCILIRRTRVLTKDKDRTKTAVERIVELNDRAAAVIERQRARTQTAGKEVFWNPTTGKPWNDEQGQRKEWTTSLRRCKIRHRPPKELRDSSVTFALMAGADPWYVARQHGHSLTVMMKDYAKWIPNADRGRNRKAINEAIALQTVSVAMPVQKL